MYTTTVADYCKKYHTFFAIDPSIRACGWARFHNNKITAGLCRSKEKDPGKAVLEIYRELKLWCPLNLDHLIIERPIIQETWTRTKVDAITKLIACYGMCLTLASEGTSLWTPSVPEWKGQLSKKISHNRMRKTLERNQIFFRYDKIPISLEHNVLDAIALLTCYLEKEMIIT